MSINSPSLLKGEKCCLCDEPATMYLMYNKLEDKSGFHEIYCWKDGSKRMIELGFLLYGKYVKGWSSNP